MIKNIENNRSKVENCAACVHSTPQAAAKGCKPTGLHSCHFKKAWQLGVRCDIGRWELRPARLGV